jgi:orotate phosphoribosyltransferase
MDHELIIAKNLLQINAIKLNPQNPFTWASGMRSPIYCDNRVTLSYPEVRKAITQAFADKVKMYSKIDMIAGVATAGIAHGALLAATLNKPFCYVRSAPKTHGRQNQIEGYIEPNANILVIEDLISTGGSSIEVVDILRKEGHNVLGVMAIFDYGFEKAKRNFASANVEFQSLSNYDVLLNLALESAYINSEEHELLKTWNNDPEQWSDNIKQQ